MWVSDSGRFDRPHLLEREVGAEVGEEPCAAAEDERNDVQFEVVDEPRRQVLIDDAGAAPMRTSFPAAAVRAWSRAASIPSVTKP